MQPSPPSTEVFEFEDDWPLEERRPAPKATPERGLRYWLGFYATRALLLLGGLALFEGVRTNWQSDTFVYPLFLARSYIFFPSYVSVGITDQISPLWRVLMAAWIVGLVLFVAFCQEKILALIAYISLPILIIIGSFQLTGAGSIYWHAGTYLIDGARYHRVAVYTSADQPLEDLWFQCNNSGFLCVRAENPLAVR